ncbi:FAD-binding oxidoreductase [Patescibacteria group bacterium]|nr:FAD-binding oxidoreductase [Patescibacteria group bacterium]
MKEEIIIVGGGVIGCACAYFLSRQGASVLLLEAEHLAAGASGATVAVISVVGNSGTHAPLQPFILESYKLIKDIEPDFGVDAEIIEDGSLFLAFTENEYEEVKVAYELALEMGIKGNLLDGNDARKMEPLLGEEVLHAFYSPACYHINPLRLCHGYFAAAKRRGCKAEYGVQVKEIRTRSDKIEKIVTNKGEYSADWVIVAAGAWTPQILNRMDIKLPISPARGQVIVTEACEPLCKRVILMPNHTYFKQCKHGNFLLGSHTELVGFNNAITLEKTQIHAKAACRAFPILSKLKAIRFFAGFRPLSPDNLPILGPVGDCSRLIIASGHGRTGIKYSASTGKAISEFVCHGKTELPIDAFSPGRFYRK